MERWDHVSLLAAGSVSPTRAPVLPRGPAQLADLSTLASSIGEEPGGCPDSPLNGFEFELVDGRNWRELEAAASIKHSGWLLKAYGSGPQRQWRRRFVYVMPDRLCYTPDPDVAGVRYIPLDRIPVRALPRGYGPKLGITMVEDRQVDRSSPQFSPKKAGCVFSVACGSHTHFFAAPTPSQAQLWVETITESWVRCIKHTARAAAHQPSAGEVAVLKEARWRAENEALRRSLAEAEQQRLRESTVQWQAAAAAAVAAQPDEAGPVACYEITVVTGRQEGAGTTSRVYLELCGKHGSSGEHRLMYRQGPGQAGPGHAAFATGATDTFRLHCRPLGRLLKVRIYHSNAGASPAWYLEEVRVRRQPSDSEHQSWTVFPCGRWLAVDQDDGRVMRELSSTAEQAGAALPPAPQPPPVQSPEPAQAPPPAQPLPQSQVQDRPQEQQVAAERVASPPVWYTIVVCTGSEEGAGLVPADGTAVVFLVLHGSRGSSQRIKLPSQPGDFERGQDDVFRVQLSCVGALEKLTVGLNSSGSSRSGGSTDVAVAWLLEQMEVTDEATGETVFFPCCAWLGKGRGGAAERSLLGSRTNPREVQQEAAHLRERAEAAAKQLANTQAELAAARAAATEAEEASHGREAELAARLAALQGEVQQLQRLLAEAQQAAAAAEARVQQLHGELSTAEERVSCLQREQAGSRDRAGAESARAAELAAELRALHVELAVAQEAAAGAAARARQCEAEARGSQAALEELRGRHEQHKRDASARLEEVESELRRLRAEAAAAAAEVREARQAEAECAEECALLSQDLATERLKAKERLEAAEKAAAEREAAVAAAAEASKSARPASFATLQAMYRVCIHTSSEPPHSGTCRPVRLELIGTGGTTGAIRLDPAAASAAAATQQGGSASPCFAAGASDVFRVEAAAVGELQQLNVWVDMEGADDVASGDASWHLDLVEVTCEGSASSGGSGSRGGSSSTAAHPTYFVCCKWLDARNGYEVQLAATTKNPRLDEIEYKVTVFTSSMAGCGTTGNVFVDLRGEQGSSGVLTLRNKGGSFRPGQADEFSFRLPPLGTLSELRVGHDGRHDWHLERVEVADSAAGTTYFFPCGKWVHSSGPGGAMARSLQLRGYTTDPASLPVRYQVELWVDGVQGRLGPGSLRLALLGSRSETGVLRLDVSRAAAGAAAAAASSGSVSGGAGVGGALSLGRHLPLIRTIEATNVGQMERLRIGLEPASKGGPACALLLPRVVVSNMESGEAATFHCPEWLHSGDPYDFEVEPAEDQEEVVCTYRVEVQTSDVRKAGTTGSVFLTIIGGACTIGPYQLSNTEAEHFGRGQLDVFEIEGAPDCGQLRQIEVRHDGSGRSNSWHLAWVKVHNATTGAVAMFKCNRWVERRSLDDPSGVVAVVVALPPDQAAAAAGRLSAKDRLLLLGGSSGVSGAKKAAPMTTTAAAAAALQGPLVRDVRMEAELGSTHHVAEVAGGRDEGAAAGLPGYRVVFHTSRICGSGTRARVHFELTGNRGSSGVLHPVGTAKSFGAGRCDIFEYPALPWLGELQSARVGTDGSGFFPAWHLQALVVTHVPSGCVWQFSCFNWIDKKANYSRRLALDSIQEGHTSAAYSSNGGGSGASYGGSTYTTAGGPTSSVWHVGQKKASVPVTHQGQQWQQQQHSSGGMGSPLAAQSLPGSPLRHKQLPGTTGSRPGSPVRVPVQQRWGGSGSPHSPMHHVLCSSSGMPGSPLIGAARQPGKGRQG